MCASDLGANDICAGGAKVCAVQNVLSLAKVPPSSGFAKTVLPVRVYTDPWDSKLAQALLEAQVYSSDEIAAER